MFFDDDDFGGSIFDHLRDDDDSDDCLPPPIVLQYEQQARQEREEQRKETERRAKELLEQRKQERARQAQPAQPARQAPTSTSKPLERPQAPTSTSKPLERPQAPTSTSKPQLSELNACVNDVRQSIEKLLTQISRLGIDNETLKNNQIGLLQEMESIKSSIILSKDNANRNGRPSINNADIELIQKLIAEGFSQRKVAEMVDVSPTTVGKYKEGKPKRQAQQAPKVEYEKANFFDKVKNSIGSSK